jgi:hypothetical protein
LIVITWHYLREIVTVSILGIAGEENRYLLNSDILDGLNLTIYRG